MSRISTVFLSSTSRAKRMPVLLGLPVLGNLVPMSMDPLGFLAGNARRFPELVYVRILGGGFYQLNDPALLEQVLVSKSGSFIKDKLLKVGSNAVFGNGLLSSDGDFWLRQRRLAQPAFHRQRIAAYGSVMTDYTQRAIASWQPGQVRDIHADMMHLTLEVVTQTLFNTSQREVVDEIGGVLDVIMERFSSQGLVALTEQASGIVINRALQMRYAAAVQKLDAIVDAVIAERRRSGEDRGDLLSMLMEARDEDGNGMSDAQLRDECKTMFLAGHETTALSLSWALWLLSLNQHAKLKLRDELAHALDGRVPTLADMPQLPYTEQIIKESMRLMPPAWMIQREATEDVSIGGYVIPKGADVAMSQYAVHRDPRWYANPERFVPERWTPEFTKQLPKFAYFPFGGGPRLCIGQQFAMMESMLMLATITQRFDLELMPGQRIVPQPSITMRPKYGLKMRVRPS